MFLAWCPTRIRTLTVLREHILIVFSLVKAWWGHRITIFQDILLILITELKFLSCSDRIVVINILLGTIHLNLLRTNNAWSLILKRTERRLIFILAHITYKWNILYLVKVALLTFNMMSYNKYEWFIYDCIFIMIIFNFY